MLVCAYNGDHLRVEGLGESWRLWPDGRAALAGARRGAAKAPTFRLLAPTPEADDPVRALEPRHVDIPGILPAEIVAAKQEAYGCFRRALPEEIVRAVEPFRAHQWHLIELLQTGAAARELALSNPALAFALANNELFRTSHASWTPVQRARQLIPRRQRDILKWLGFPGTEAAATLFRKLTANAVHATSLRLLREVMAREPVARWLAHLQRPNAGVLACISNRALHALLSPVLLEDIARSAEDDVAAPAADLLNDVLALWKDVKPDRSPPRPVCLDDARRLHDELILARNEALEAAALARQRSQEEAAARAAEQRRLRRAQPVRRRRRALEQVLPLAVAQTAIHHLPAPPFAGNESIVPLTTTAQLDDEGRCMKNCVGTYAERVAAGRTYIYRVWQPERATLSIYRVGPRWCLDQLRLARNKDPSPGTRRFVIEWLYAVQQEITPKTLHHDKRQMELGTT